MCSDLVLDQDQVQFVHLTWNESRYVRPLNTVNPSQAWRIRPASFLDTRCSNYKGYFLRLHRVEPRQQQFIFPRNDIKSLSLEAFAVATHQLIDARNIFIY